MFLSPQRGQWNLLYVSKLGVLGFGVLPGCVKVHTSSHYKCLRLFFGGGGFWSDRCTGAFNWANCLFDVLDEVLFLVTQMSIIWQRCYAHQELKCYSVFFGSQMKLKSEHRWEQCSQVLLKYKGYGNDISTYLTVTVYQSRSSSDWTSECF